ncbi:MAG: cob(I)yrinic acid a,c-diamide adenosyltransferase [Bacteroidetes bacterium]|nr:cob(I)yrinic acid a,c-diamide adenosyltransferase [Bacteroidota bacterium]
MEKEWKIYTKTGDGGETSLIGGSRVPKFHSRIEAYGTLDELNSFVGYLRDHLSDEHSRATLLEIQDRLFTAESLLAADPSLVITQKLPLLFEEDVLRLEHEMDEMNKALPDLHSFVLPGGHPHVSLCHVCRTICRRAERVTNKLASEEEIVHPEVLRYLNRLSDYFFVLSRKLAFDMQIRDNTWKARIT